jgi:putative transposase
MPVVFEFKVKGKPCQYQAIDEAIRTGQFVRNKCIRLWMDVKGTNKYDLSAYCKMLAKEFPFANQLNSTARQAMAERAWASINRFYENCKRQIPGKKGYPRFKKFSRSVEYKQSGWKLSEDRKKITFTDKIGVGTLKLKGTWDLHFYQIQQIKRVRLIRRADGYYVQFLINTDITQRIEPTGHTIGLDVGLKEFYTDNNGDTVDNPRFYRLAEKRMKFSSTSSFSQKQRQCQPQESH